MNYLNEVCKVLDTYFASCKKPEALKVEAQRQRREGIITPEYERQCLNAAERDLTAARGTARGAFANLRSMYAAACRKACTVDPASFDSADYKLLKEDYPLTLDEFKEICERNKGNATILRKAIEVGRKNHWELHAMAYYKTPEECTAAFDRLLHLCEGILTSEPTSPARGPAYWAMISREFEPMAER